jgi:hypothetical protein
LDNSSAESIVEPSETGLHIGIEVVSLAMLEDYESDLLYEGRGGDVVRDSLLYMKFMEIWLGFS